MMLPWAFMSAGFLAASLASFGWAMRWFFHQPSGDTAGMKTIRACSLASAVLNFAAILTTPDVGAGQFLAGACLYSAAMILFFWAIRANQGKPLSAVFSTDLPMHLVDTGPYRFVRHPFYCAYLLTWTAGLVATGRWWLLLSLAVMLVLYRRAANMEEAKFAASPLASAYRQYQDDTGQFVPNPASWIRMLKKRDHASRLA